MFLFSFFLFQGLFLVSHWIVSPFFSFLVLSSKHCNFYALDIKSDVFSCFFLQKYADQMWSLDFISFFLSYGNNIWYVASYFLCGWFSYWERLWPAGFSIYKFQMLADLIFDVSFHLSSRIFPWLKLIAYLWAVGFFWLSTFLSSPLQSDVVFLCGLIWDGLFARKCVGSLSRFFFEKNGGKNHLHYKLVPYQSHLNGVQCRWITLSSEYIQGSVWVPYQGFPWKKYFGII